MRSPCGRYVLVYNGEIYNYREIRRGLADSAELRGTSDTEVLLHAIRQLGVEGAVSRANGMFAFALWDTEQAELVLVRDRIGIKPLFWGRIAGTLAFASELRGIRPAFEGSSTVDPRALSLFLRYGYTPGRGTILAGVEKVPPGTILRIRRDNDGGFVVDERAYWSVFDHLRPSKAAPTDREAVDSLEDLLRDAVKGQLVADVDVGAFLSGGIDSSAVVALMTDVVGRRVKTFSVGFDDPRFDESAYATRVASHLGTEHHTLRVTGGEALGVVPTLASLYSEPFADASSIPTLLVSRLARRDVTVALSGDGGDELFGGYRHYELIERLSRMLSGAPRGARVSVGGWAQVGARWARKHKPRSGMPFLDRSINRRLIQVELLGGYFRGSANSIEALYDSFLDSWRGENVVRGAPVAPLMEVVRGAGLGAASTQVQLMLRDLLVYLPDDILTKVDRASMSCGLEVRVPLLDHRVVEFAFGLPDSLRVRQKATKWLLRQVLHRRLPRDLFVRPKQGFSVPLAGWLRGPLREWAEALLTKRRLRDDGYFDVDTVRAYWGEHVGGRQDWSSQIWAVLMFQAWLDAQREGVGGSAVVPAVWPRET
jgi:asparagine synthase (glutamine-hydrolysing)